MSDDKVFLITGASTGIGAETAREAVKAGYKVALAARSVGKLAALVDELGGKETALAISCDVTSVDDQKRMVSETLAQFGRIDVVFANAGIGATAMGTEQGDPGNWRDMILTNVYGLVLTAKVTLPHLKKSKGHILLTGSRAGRIALKGSVYGATKWAVTGYGQNLREEVAGTGIRVTLIEPGMVDTPFFDERKPHALKAIDVANAVMYAASQPPHVDVAEVLVIPTPQAEG
ncbi:SDR family oxidoreductase [Tepidamorphus sp. 3E244]|uniref:SDR family oxidoreductase n=1 Tax=Tepidamorphus sp. 3E244 TaxID=3385498 RepID=UPI0038FCAA4E